MVSLDQSLEYIGAEHSDDFQLPAVLEQGGTESHTFSFFVGDDLSAAPGDGAPPTTRLRVTCDARGGDIQQLRSLEHGDIHDQDT